MNNVVLIGRLTKDAETRYGGDNQTAVSRFTLAVDRRFKKDGEQSADFISCVAFGKTAEFIEKYASAKGTKLAVEGSIRTGSYTNREGNKVYTTDVVVSAVEFAESKGNKTEQAQTPATPTPDGDFMSIPDDIDEELPFN